MMRKYSGTTVILLLLLILTAATLFYMTLSNLNSSYLETATFVEAAREKSNMDTMLPHPAQTALFATFHAIGTEFGETQNALSTEVSKITQTGISQTQTAFFSTSTPQAQH